MADISQVAIDSTIYNIKDTVARQNINNLNNNILLLNSMYQAGYGSPILASSAADMSNPNAIYIYTGTTENGLTNGDWYYWDSSLATPDWVSGGAYGDLQIDDSLTQQNCAADAKAAGDEINALRALLAQTKSDLNDSIKLALLDCFKHVAWIDEHGENYYNALEQTFYMEPEYIQAIFTQGNTVIYDTASLASLKRYLMVTAFYPDNSSKTVVDYTLSGTLTAGTSMITVSYAEKTTTFSVTVTHRTATLQSISCVYTQNGTIYETDSLNSLKNNLVVTAHYSDSSSENVQAADYTLSGTLSVGTSTVTVTYNEKTTTFTVTVSQFVVEPTGISCVYTQGDPIYSTDALNSIKKYLTVTMNYNDNSTSPISIDSCTLSGTLTTGTSTITVTYESFTTTVAITVSENTTGILYDWDFTESLTDKRQVTTALLATGEAWEIPGKSEGTTVPTRTSSGVVFDNAQQLVRLISKDVETTSFLLDKTIQVDFASYNPQVTVNSSYPEVRILSVSWDNSQSVRAFELGIRYQYWVNGNSSHGNPSDGSTATFEGLTFTNAPWNNGLYFDKIQASPAFTQSSISGHTLSVYIDSQGLWHVYIDTTLVGTSTHTVTNTASIYGLQIGVGGRPGYGGILYNATVSGARIYDGNIMS